MQGFIDGFSYHPGYFDRAAQDALVADIRSVLQVAPLYTPTMPRTGKELSVRMSNCGSLGWLTDKANGYRYQATHPATGQPWPAIPAILLKLWQDVSNFDDPPEACLINWYAASAKMGLHVDNDETEFSAPVVSVSMGDDAWFRIGGTTRKDKTQRIRLGSGDVLVMGDKARLAYHGIDRIIPGTSTLLDAPGRINLTLRRVNGPTGR